MSHALVRRGQIGLGTGDAEAALLRGVHAPLRPALPSAHNTAPLAAPGRPCASDARLFTCRLPDHSTPDHLLSAPARGSIRAPPDRSPSGTSACPRGAEGTAGPCKQALHSAACHTSPVGCTEDTTARHCVPSGYGSHSSQRFPRRDRSPLGLARHSVHGHVKPIAARHPHPTAPLISAPPQPCAQRAPTPQPRPPAPAAGLVDSDFHQTQMARAVESLASTVAEACPGHGPAEGEQRPNLFNREIHWHRLSSRE